MSNIINEYAKKWVEALRSGEYKQGKYQLKTFDEEGNTCYCCLGVAEEVIDEVKRYCDNSLAYESLELIGIDTEIEGKLIYMNDEEEKSFNEIADYIEKVTK